MPRSSSSLRKCRFAVASATKYRATPSASVRSRFTAAVDKLPWIAAYHFNLALSLERQTLCGDARSSWLRALELEHIESERARIREHLAINYESPGGRCSVRPN